MWRNWARLKWNYVCRKSLKRFTLIYSHIRGTHSISLNWKFFFSSFFFFLDFSAAIVFHCMINRNESPNGRWRKFVDFCCKMSISRVLLETCNSANRKFGNPHWNYGIMEMLNPKCESTHIFDFKRGNSYNTIFSQFDASTLTVWPQNQPSLNQPMIWCASDIISEKQFATNYLQKLMNLSLERPICE